MPPPVCFRMSIIYGLILDYSQKSDYNFNKKKKGNVSRCMIKSALYADFCACFARRGEK